MTLLPLKLFATVNFCLPEEYLYSHWDVSIGTYILLPWLDPYLPLFLTMPDAERTFTLLPSPPPDSHELSKGHGSSPLRDKNQAGIIFSDAGNPLTSRMQTKRMAPTERAWKRFAIEGNAIGAC
jgi:hypothetical protein